MGGRENRALDKYRLTVANIETGGGNKLNFNFENFTCSPIRRHLMCFRRRLAVPKTHTRRNTK